MAVLAVVNSEEFASLPPSQIVPTLLDRGVYLASESTMCRLLRHWDLKDEVWLNPERLESEQLKLAA